VQLFSVANFWRPTTVSLALLLGLCPAAAQAGLIVNGSFETPDAGPVFAQRDVGFNIDGWVVYSGNVDHIGQLWQSAEGEQNIDLNGSTAGGIYQDFATTAGQSYLIRFALSENFGSADKRLEVLWEGLQIADITVVHDPTRTGVDMKYIYHELTAVAVDGTTRLAFNSLTGAQNGAVGFAPFYGPVLDDVSVNQQDSGAVPEPASLAVWLSAIGGVIVTRWRRGRNAHQAASRWFGDQPRSRTPSGSDPLRPAWSPS
jgi:choice-of-anchor C domain-containing protein